MYRADNQTMVRGYSQKIIKGNFNQTSTETGFYGAVIKNDSAFKIKPETERAEISKNNVWSEKFGNGLQGAMALASLLKSRHSERITKQLLDQALEQGDATKLNESVSRLSGGPAGGGSLSEE